MQKPLTVQIGQNYKSICTIVHSLACKSRRNKENREILSYLGLFLVIPCYYMHLTGSVGEYSATPNIERAEIMKFTTSSTRRIGSVLVLHRWSKAATWLVTGPKYLKSFVPREISMHRMKLFTLFTSAILFYLADSKRFVRFNAARKDVE